VVLYFENYDLITNGQQVLITVLSAAKTLQFDGGSVQIVSVDTAKRRGGNCAV